MFEQTIFAASGSFAVLEWLAILFVGAVVGSFLNVLTYRLPIMCQRHRLEEYGVVKQELPMGGAPYNLFWPPSHCPFCRVWIRPWHNIPLFSYLQLRARAPCCGNRISPHYFLTEIAAVFLFFLAWLLWNDNPWQAMARMLGLALLLSMALMSARIDAAQMERDVRQGLAVVAQTFLWSALFASAMGWLASVEQTLFSSAPFALGAVLLSGYKKAPLAVVAMFWLAAGIGAWTGNIVAAAGLWIAVFLLNRILGFSCNSLQSIMAALGIAVLLAFY